MKQKKKTRRLNKKLIVIGIVSLIVVIVLSCLVFIEADKPGLAKVDRQQMQADLETIKATVPQLSSSEIEESDGRCAQNIFQDLNNQREGYTPKAEIVSDELTKEESNEIETKLRAEFQALNYTVADYNEPMPGTNPKVTSRQFSATKERVRFVVLIYGRSESSIKFFIEGTSEVCP